MREAFRRQIQKHAAPTPFEDGERIGRCFEPVNDPDERSAVRQEGATVKMAFTFRAIGLQQRPRLTPSRGHLEQRRVAERIDDPVVRPPAGARPADDRAGLGDELGSASIERHSIQPAVLEEGDLPSVRGPESALGAFGAADGPRLGPVQLAYEEALRSRQRLRSRTEGVVEESALQSGSRVKQNDAERPDIGCTRPCRG